jgi:hypothetical protein
MRASHPDVLNGGSKTLKLYEEDFRDLPNEIDKRKRVRELTRPHTVTDPSGPLPVQRPFSKTPLFTANNPARYQRQELIKNLEHIWAGVAYYVQSPLRISQPTSQSQQNFNHQSGKKANWVQTVPGKFWFPYFRPLRTYADVFRSKLATHLDLAPSWGLQPSNSVSDYAPRVKCGERFQLLEQALIARFLTVLAIRTLNWHCTCSCEVMVARSLAISPRRLI